MLNAPLVSTLMASAPSAMIDRSRYSFGTTEREKRRYAAPSATPDKALGVCSSIVRDQGVGGSNPLSPTNLFNYLGHWPSRKLWIKIQKLVAQPVCRLGSPISPTQSCARSAARAGDGFRKRLGSRQTQLWPIDATMLQRRKYHVCSLCLNVAPRYVLIASISL
jgi:hypothetical protein